MVWNATGEEREGSIKRKGKGRSEVQQRTTRIPGQQTPFQKGSAAV